MILPMPELPRESVSETTIAAALARIPPLWPLKHFVAVNPFLGLLHQPFAEACETLRKVAGSYPLPTPREYRDWWIRGIIPVSDLDRVVDAEWTRERLVEALTALDGVRSTPLPTFADFLDRQVPGSHWGALVVEEISKWCAVAFDQNQAIWKSPWLGSGLYSDWKAAASLDRNPEALGLRGFRKFVQALPEDSLASIRLCVERLEPSMDLTDFLHRELATVAGWAGHLQYRVREAGMRGRRDDSLRDLLAIRLAFDAALKSAFGSDAGIVRDWKAVRTPKSDPASLEALLRWQRTYETGYQRNLARLLMEAPRPKEAGRPAVQTIFCIDVRSEVFRRHLEAAHPGLQTIGFAGFFGFPVAHRSLTGELGSRCPVLLVPPVESADGLGETEVQAGQAARAESEAWRAVQYSAASCFSFVETAGLGFAGTLNRPTGAIGPRCGAARPVLHPGDAASLGTRATMAEGALRNMSLTRDFARLVLICGHGSQSANNPYASGLDCGACGGHAGDVNARLAADALNDPEVRRILASRGLRVPEDTYFIAGLHNTTTDEVLLFEPSEVPASHHEELLRLQRALSLAGEASRRERAGSLAIGIGSEEGRRNAFSRRAADISEVRPEWGLANNAAFIAAPRHRTLGQALAGRVFLHDYDANADPESKVLTLILCAPVVVASWINLQYYGSRVNPDVLGSGNKVLHNVVGGIGVVEGNGGDLRVGLPLQSLHDGEKFVHEPRRLSVFVEAQTDRIDQVLENQPSVRHLFDHGWIHLFSIQDGVCLRRTSTGWDPVA